MINENASPAADTSATAGATDANAEEVALNNAEGIADESNEEAKTKPEKTPEQREIERLRRGIDRKTRQLAEERARNSAPKRNDVYTAENEGDDEPLKLTRAQIQELVKAEAEKLAPTLHEKASEIERRKSVVQNLSKAWGQEKFDELASDLDEAFGGLTDRDGKPRPATEAIFEADNAAVVIEYLADPDHAEEAESISRMSAVQAGKAIAKLEAKLAAVSVKSKPKVSSAATPLEAVRGAGHASKSLADLDGDDFAKKRREQIAKRH
jgi:hypothetical protein